MKEVIAGFLAALLIFVFCIVNLINIIPFEVQRFTCKKNILMTDLKRQRREGIKLNYITEG